MADDDGRSADSSLDDDAFHLDPAYGTSTDDPPPVWAESDRMRDLITKTRPDADERKVLQTAVVRQLRTALLHEAVLKSFPAVAADNEAVVLVLYVILFPGEGRDGTGMKDLNDNILGYNLHAEFIRERHESIRVIFAQHGFTVVGQDYKTSLILASVAGGKGARDGSRKSFDVALRELDAKLRDTLIALLKRVEAQYKQEAEKLRKKLEAHPDYRFDIYYGLSVAELGGYYA